MKIIDKSEGMKKKGTLKRLLYLGILLVVVIALIGGGLIIFCSSGDPPQPNLNYPRNISKDEQVKFVMQEHLCHEGCQPVHSFALYVENEPEKILIHKGLGIVGRDETPIHEDYQFKIASITKTVVATVIFQLMEEGRLDLNDRAGKYLERIDYLRFDELHQFQGKSYSDAITIDHLLQHRSGLGDIFIDTEKRFIASVLLHPRRLYSPKRIMDTYFDYGLNERSHFEPGKGYYYSDINYVLLGLIIEQITGHSLPDQIRKRVLVPLRMNNTYFEFYEPETGNRKRIDSYLAFINIDRNLYTSHEWAGGGLVSTTQDLATFIKALFAMKLFKYESTLQLMLDNSKNKAEGATYARGINYYTLLGETYYGHGGYYGSLLLHNPENGITFAAHLAQAASSYNKQQIVKLVETILEIAGNR